MEHKETVERKYNILAEVLPPAMTLEDYMEMDVDSRKFDKVLNDVYTGHLTVI